MIISVTTSRFSLLLNKKTVVVGPKKQRQETYTLKHILHRERFLTHETDTLPVIKLFPQTAVTDSNLTNPSVYMLLTVSVMNHSAVMSFLISL